ncbi:hypothetical protein KIW84_010266 [Lathyrus oleraceus]|uniref:Uncharacterized protein n=1 Tax=Pisum sativum TaxID=3888 RepID=A0A9D4YKR6_PEA|nr:hypothetical protein KIW84_010266 [Pisum sativum]
MILIAFNFCSRLCRNLMKRTFIYGANRSKPYINAHNIDLVVCTRNPPHFLDDDARSSGTVNSEYSRWLQKDQTLLSWLHLTLSNEIISHVLGCSHVHQLWDRLFNYEFMLKVRAIVDSLASIGDPAPASHHIDVILRTTS